MIEIISDREPDVKTNYCRSDKVVWKNNEKVYGKKLGDKTW